MRDFKVVSGMIVYNNKLLVEAAIRSVLGFVDKIAIVDGSPWGPSTDGTAEIIQSIHSDKIEYISGTWNNKTEQRNEYVKMLKTYQARKNWLFMIDADEVYKPADLQMVENAMDLADPFETSIYVKHIHFWRNFSTVITGGMWGGPKANVLFRINRFWKGTYYGKHNSLGFESENGYQSLDLGEKSLASQVRVYHYGHALSLESEWVRSYYMAKRGDYEGVSTEKECRQHAKQAAHNWLYGEGHGKGVHEETFNDTHPSEIQKLIEKKRSVLTWNDPKQVDFNEEIKEIEAKYSAKKILI